MAQKGLSNNEVSLLGQLLAEGFRELDAETLGAFFDIYGAPNLDKLVVEMKCTPQPLDNDYVRYLAKLVLISFMEQLLESKNAAQDLR